jgi:hypothetical protein
VFVLWVAESLMRSWELLPDVFKISTTRMAYTNEYLVTAVTYLNIIHPFNQPIHTYYSLLYSTTKIKIYRTIIFPVVLYGCETWSVTLREEHMLRVFENRVLRRIFGSQRDEVTGEWRRLHNEELNDLYSSPNIVRVIKSRRMRWAGHVARMGEGRGAYRVLVGRPERTQTTWKNQA